MASFKTLIFVFAAIFAIALAEEGIREKKGIYGIGYGYGLGYTGLGYAGIDYRGLGYSGYPYGAYPYYGYY